MSRVGRVLRAALVASKAYVEALLLYCNKVGFASVTDVLVVPLYFGVIIDLNEQ